MVRIILNGCNGKMGRVIAACVDLRDDCEIVAGVDIDPLMNSYFPVFTSIFDVHNEADVIIDFSHPSALSDLLKYSLQKAVPIVVATTGLSEEQISKVRETSKDVGVFYSGNMSLGINLLCELVKKASAILSASFDIEIVEAHHNQKIDAPSGTALMLADAANESGEYEYTYDRHSRREKRGRKEIGIHAVRGGTIVGEHEVIFAGHDEVVKLSHSAGSKEVFASGAIEAGIFMSGKAPGLYNMTDLIGSAVN